MFRCSPLLLLALAAPAAATGAFPNIIRDTLALDAAPACTVCHTDPGGGSGTATKPFAESLVAAGLEAFDRASLEAALATLEADGTDSDGDGVGDIDELKAGTDPNPAASGEGEGELEPILYGFGCAEAPAASGLGLAMLLLLVRRRSRAQTVAASSMSSSLSKA